MISSFFKSRKWTVAALSLVAVVCCFQETLSAACQVGFQHITSFDDNSACVPFNCTARNHILPKCEEMFPNSYCKAESSTCECVAGYQLDADKKHCIRNNITNPSCQLGYKWNDFLDGCVRDTKKYTLQYQTCTSDIDCGINSSCHTVNGEKEGICKCHFGNSPTSNQVDCAPTECDDDFDCRSSSQHGVCRNSVCHCQTGYKLDPFYHICKKVVQPIQSCTRNFECSPNSVCFSGRCRCNMGFLWDDDQNRCNSIICHSSDDCSTFPKTRCNELINRCVCDNGMELDARDQTCSRRKVYDTTTTTEPTTTSTQSPNKCIDDSQCNSPFVCNSYKCTCPFGMHLDQEENICRFNVYTVPPHYIPDDHTSHSHSSHSSDVGLIIGSSVGGLAVFVAVFVLLCWLCKRRQVAAERGVQPTPRRPPVVVNNHARPPISISPTTVPTGAQPSAPTVTPPSARNTHFQHPQQLQYQVPAQPSYNPGYQSNNPIYYNQPQAQPVFAPPPSYSAAINNANDGIRVYPSLPKH